MKRGLAEFILRHRIVVLAFLAVISLVALYFCFKLEFDASIDIWFLESDPTLVTYDQFLKRFEADEVTVLAMFVDDVFTPENLKALERITRAVKEAPYIHSVASLANIDTIKGEQGEVFIGPLIKTLPENRQQADEIRKLAMDNPLIAGLLVSKDQKVAAVILELDRAGANFQGKVELVNALKQLREKEQTQDRKIYLTGTSVFDAAFYEYSNRDFMVFGPVTFLLVIFASFFVFRRFSAAIIPLSVVSISCIWTFGLMGALGIKINVMSSALAGLILAVGIADSIHIVSDYYQELMHGRTPDDAAKQSISQLLVPCLFTSATTAAGMLSLLISDLEPIRQFGWLAALSVIFAFVVSFAFVPTVLNLAKPPDPKFILRQSAGPMNIVLKFLGRPGVKRSRWVLSVFAVLMIISVYFLTTLQVGSNPMNYFKKLDPVRVETQIVDEALGGSATIDFLVRAKNEGLKNPEILKRLDDFERWMDGREGITQSLSVVDTLKEVNRVFHDGDPAFFKVPETRALAAQYYLLLEGEDDFDNYVQENYSVGRMTSRIELSAAQALVHGIPELEQRVKDEFSGEELRVETTGLLVLMARMEQYLVDNQIKSFLIAFVVISMMMIMVLRSVRLGLFSMIPNVAPIVCGIAFMAAVGISLDVGTIMIGSIALGLVVDDSVHFLVRLRRFLDQGNNMETSIFNTTIETGRPIIVTSVVLAAGFSVLLLGSFAPNIYFGMISAIVILIALVFDLLVLPSALMVLQRFIKVGR